MTAPLPQGGRPVTLPAGGSAQLLTQSAVGSPPLLLVNISTDRAWVAGDDSVGPSNGVPLDPGTAVPWIASGLVYAAADQDAANPITVYITSAISTWTPSPAAIAAEVATALLASGVPSVLVERDVAIHDVIPASGSKRYAVGDLASLALIAGANVAATDLNLTISWLTAGSVLVDSDFLYAVNDGTHNAQVFARLAVEAATVEVFNGSGVAATVTITGSNRIVPKRIDARASSTEGMHFSFTGAIAANATKTLAPFDNAVKVTGPATCTFRQTGVATGRFEIVTPSVDVAVCDTAEMITAADGSKYLCRQLILPESSFGMRFVAAGTGQATGAVSADLLVG